VLGLGEVDEDELYTALDWLLERQPAIEATLAKRHLTNGTLVLYDVSSSYMEGRCCPLAKRGYSRDGRKGTLQIVYGLLCAPDGCPVAIEVFDGNTADPMTLATQVEKLKQRFHLDHVVLVGDRGMITQARITEDIKSAGLDWITALRAPTIKELLNSGALQLSLFDQRDMASITSPDFPGERLVVCRNPDLAAERTRKREDLLAATERDLTRIKAAVDRKRNPLRGTAAIALAVGAVIDTHKMRKHFDLDITDTAFSFARKTGEIAAEAATDGIYVVRTSLPAETLDDAATVRSYKSLALVERAFRCIKTVDLHARPPAATPRRAWIDELMRASPSSTKKTADAVRNRSPSRPIAKPIVATKSPVMVNDVATPPASQYAPERCVVVAAPMTSGRRGKTQGERVDRMPASSPAPMLVIGTFQLAEVSSSRLITAGSVAPVMRPVSLAP
jgi:hypothetical protein